MLSPSKAIGGYFELELPLEKREKYPGALKFQSARAAFYALLQKMQTVRRVFAPAYICDSMLAPITTAGKKLELYEIDENLFINEKITLSNTDLLLYVNYFGVCSANVKKVLKQYCQDQVVIDCSQAFYSGPYECLATIYSPRKFFGVPDGGLLITKNVLETPVEQDEGSVSRMIHLLQRLAFSAEEGYANYKTSEESLNDLIPRQMSNLTQRLLEAVEYSKVEIKRKSNFSFLHNILASSNLLPLDDINEAPMCYPYLPSKGIDRSFLAAHRIYVPTYWPDVLTRGNTDGFGIRAARELIAIPCDHRYDIDDMNRIVKGLRNGLLS